MKYSEILERTQIVRGVISPEPKLAIFKKELGGKLIEAIECRELTKQEIYAYTTALIDYLIEKGKNQISTVDGKVWRFERIDKENK